MIKTSLPRDSFLLGLHRILGAVQNRGSTLPTLQCVLIEARARFNLVTFTATDLQMQLQSRIGADGVPDFRLLVPARKLKDILANLPAESMLNLSIDPQGHKLAIQCGRARFSLACMDPDNFPAFDVNESRQAYALALDNFKLMLERCAWCMGTADVRYWLNGMRLYFANEYVEAAASNGHYLGVQRVEPFQNMLHGSDREIIVPRHCVLELNAILGDKLLPEALGDMQGVRADVGERTLLVKLPTVDVAVKLIEGRFPDVGRFYPRSLEADIKLDVAPLQEAVARVSTLTNDNTKAMMFELGDGQLRLFTVGNEEEAFDALDVDQPGTCAVSFNAHYVQEALRKVGASRVRFGFNSEAPTVIEPAQANGGYFILMPMRV